jgi:hypothetical protein
MLGVCFRGGRAGRGPASEIPVDLNQAVVKLACMSVMNVLGDLIGGLRMLGSSVGMDGLSPFISMTTTGALFSRVLQYRPPVMIGAERPDTLEPMVSWYFSSPVHYAARVPHERIRA